MQGWADCGRLARAARTALRRGVIHAARLCLLGKLVEKDTTAFIAALQIGG